MSETHLSEIRVDPLINKEEVLIQNNQPQELKMDETLGNNSSQNNERSLWLGSIMREATEDENNQPLSPKMREDENDQSLLGKKIPRVPPTLMDENEECYIPKVVSIGPYHYPKPYDTLTEVETLKVPMARQFILDSEKDIELIYSELQKVIQTAREFYDEDSITRFDDEQFARMMFIDGCFILQFMHCLHYGSEKLEMSDRQIFHVKRDLLLLENQLPFAVLDSLREQRYKNLSESNEIINDFLSLRIRSSSKPIPKWVPIALTTLGLVMIPILFPLFLLCFIILACHVFFSYRRVGPFRYSKNVSLDWSPPPPKKTQPEHLLQLLYYKSMYHYSKRNQKKPPPGSRGHGLYYSAKNLKKAGIRFRPRWTGAITDVKFKPSLLSGKVEAPPIIIDESTESLLLNLVVYESAVALDQVLWVSSYILFMDSLIDDAEDVEELRSNGIIINYLGADQNVANLFNEMGKSLKHDTYDTAAYNEVKMAINMQCESTVKRWAYEWKKTYFSNPWTFITVLAASFGLCLTATQTYYTRFPPK